MTHETSSDRPLPFEITEDIESGSYSVVRIPPGWKFERNGSVDQLHNGEEYYSLFFGRDMGAERGTAMILLQEPISDIRVVNKASISIDGSAQWFSKVLSGELGDKCLVGDLNVVDPETAFDLLEEAVGDVGRAVEQQSYRDALGATDMVGTALAGLRQHLLRAAL